MSRIIVKNLPKTITEEKLRQLFGQKGHITDVQLKYTPDGKFRQFAFVGFQNENEADRAIKAFNNTRVNTNKISVEQCALLGDANKPRAWSKYAADSSAFKKSHPELEEEKLKAREKLEAEEKLRAKESKKAKKKAAKEAAAALLEKYKDDPLFEEFIQVQNPSKSQEVLAALNKSTKDNSDSGQESGNEDVETQAEAAKTEGQEEGSDGESGDDEEDTDKLANQNISDLEYMKLLKEKAAEPKKPRKEKKPKEKIALFTVKLKGLPYNCKKQALKQFFQPLSLYSIRIPRQVKGIAYIGFKTEDKLKKALLKDRSILGGKRIFITKYTSDENQGNAENNTGNNAEDPRKHKWKSQEESLKNEEDIAESGRIFVRNLAYTITENDIQTLFEKFGPLAEVALPIDSVTRKPKGFGVVTFVMPEHAVKAYSELDGTIQQGRLLHLLPGKAKDNAEEEQAGDENSNFKKKKAAKQKTQAGSTHNWNSLFLAHDAVANVMADTYGTSKEAVLDPHGKGNAAVRLALGETQIVANTKKYLEQEGVVLDAFSTPNSKRSKTVILVKNLPANTELKEINGLFDKFGVLGRVVLPPSCLTALVEFVEPSEARKAFSKLAYSKFKYLPLYLEWAPENCLLPKSSKGKSFDSNEDQSNQEQSNQGQSKQFGQEESNQDKSGDNLEDGSAMEEEEEEPEPDTTLFVKNLNFKTTDAELRKHFTPCGKIHSATVATKKDKNNPSTILSMGYGFVRFTHKKSSDKALKTMQQSVLDGKSLELKRSERTLQNDPASARKAQAKTKQTGTKILVRNIPFQAKRKELFELFKAFGEIKALRLPKKMTGTDVDSHRGFAFVDYVVNGDAKRAFEALCQSTHLYGRRLVLEWAAAEEGVEELRKRTAKHFHQDEEVRSKKSVLDIDDK